MKVPAPSLVGLLLPLIALVFLSYSAAFSSVGVVISQVYGGGGNTGATYKNDFIELFNGGPVAIDLTGWSVQYASAAGLTWQKTDLSGTIEPNHYYLVQEDQGAGGTVDLPTPDAIGTIAMSGTNGKVVVMWNNTLIATGTVCPTGGTIVDFVGYGNANCFEGAGAAPVLTNTTAGIRKENGLTDTNDNSADFSTGTPNPRNSASPPLPIQLAFFSATSLESGSVELTWATVSEVNNYGFEVQRSIDLDSEFKTISPTIPGHGTTNVRFEYTYIDRAAGPGQWFYRLKQIDMDGTVHYPQSIMFEMQKQGGGDKLPGEFCLYQNFPNPFNPTTLIRYTLPVESGVKLAVYNALGQEVATLIDGTKPAGLYAAEFEASRLVSGTYFCRLQAGEIRITKRMILLR